MLVIDFAMKIIGRINLTLERHKVNKLKTLLNTVGNNFKLTAPYEVINPAAINIGQGFSAEKGLKINSISNYAEQYFIPKISIGDNVFINSNTHIACIEKITIGNNVLIASKVYISDHSHGHSDMGSLKVPPIMRRLYSKPVLIEDNVWIGEGVSILMGVTIGKNSIIGANAMVNKSFPPNSVIGGVPAKLIKTIN